MEVRDQSGRRMEKKFSELMRSIQDRTAILYEPNCNWSICRVPQRLREVNEDAYTPRIVSIGPFHSGQPKLEAMEVHKTRYMEFLMQRTQEPKVTLSKCAEAVVNLEERALLCYTGYDHDDQNKRRTTFAEILLVDGCFILELLLRWTMSSSSSVDHHNTIDEFGGVWMVDCLQRDLTLLENQIPFFVLECLFELIMGRIQLEPPPYSITELCVLIFGSCLTLNKRASNDDHEYSSRHLLDLIHNCYLVPSYPKSTKPKHKEQSLAFFYCATKLTESGIKFVKSDSENLLDIKFGHNGVLEIPQLFIHDSTDSLLRNLIAFEQCCDGISHHITSYAILMNRLIQSSHDVEILENERIIENCLGHGKEVSKLFDKICKEVVVKDFFFHALYEQVAEHYNFWWPRNKTVLTRDYCSNPWKFLSVVAASVLLILSVFQTAYTIASYYPH